MITVTDVRIIFWNFHKLCFKQQNFICELNRDVHSFIVLYVETRYCLSIIMLYFTMEVYSPSTYHNLYIPQSFPYFVISEIVYLYHKVAVNFKLITSFTWKLGLPPSLFTSLETHGLSHFSYWDTLGFHWCCRFLQWSLSIWYVGFQYISLTVMEDIAHLKHYVYCNLYKT